MIIKKLLEERNMTMYRLAKETGISKTTIADICRGDVALERCCSETLYKIAKILGVTMESILEAEKKRKEQL